MSDDSSPSTPAISIAANGPYLVSGGVPLYRRRAVHSEHGEPLAWETREHVDSADRYALCRCGQSERKPFCDGSHARQGFVADDVASGSYDERCTDLGGTGITVRDDRSVCAHAGFCGTRVSNVWKMVADTAESTVRAQVIGMIEHCPSGALTYRLDGEADVEPLMPAAVGVTDDGPLWVTGAISITSSTGEQLEARNRVTLCRCGGSSNKPLCDGSHNNVGFKESGSTSG